MGSPPKNFVESFLPIITLHAIFGHEVFHFPASKPRYRLSVCYMIVMSVTTGILFYVTFIYALKLNYQTFEEKFLVFICGMNIVVVLCTGSLSWYHYNRRQCIMESIIAIDETLTKLGGDCKHDNTYRTGIVCIIIRLIVAVSLNAIDTLWVIDNHTGFEIFWIIAVFHYPHHVSGSVLMKSAMMIRAVGVRFRVTNEILQEIQKNKRDRQLRGQLIISDRIAHVATVIDVASAETNDKHMVEIIKQVHLELCTISEGLDEIFGFQIVLQLGVYFVFCTILGYGFYVIRVNSSFLHRTRRMLALSFWFFEYFFKILIINHVGASVTHEAYKTREIIQELNMVTRNPELKDDARHFSLQMIQNTLSFAPLGFFTLGYGLFSSILGTVATYLVILIQTNIIPEFMLANNEKK